MKELSSELILCCIEKSPCRIERTLTSDMNYIISILDKGHVM